ncbi:MAG: pyridoxal 5'-phosphate synthase glutaminase subunit PdxT [Armatimonadota bacterium]|nr:pyridoxal 5'-phosphate synthase glutaminase subunit PdxT [Armatimonadota bacterium]
MVGVLALQGDFSAHLRALESLGVDACEVRTPDDLEGCERLIMPGGESTTLGILLKLSALDAAIPDRVRSGMPVWGTCMGMILLAKEIEGSDQFRFGLLDVTVRRNAFGAQVFSFEQGIAIQGLDEPVHAVFIRAPIVTRCGVGVEPLAEVEGKVVAVRSGSILGTSFHPELTDDTRLHEHFLGL